MLNLPKDHFEILPVSFLSGATLYCRQMNGPQLQVWYNIIDKYLKDQDDEPGSGQVDIFLYRASLIACSLIEFEPKAFAGQGNALDSGKQDTYLEQNIRSPDHKKTGTLPAVFEADDQDRIYMSSTPCRPDDLVFKDYLLTKHSIEDEVRELLDTLVSSWSKDRLNQIASQLEVFNGMKDTDLVREEHESQVEYEERIAAKKSQGHQNSGTG